MVMTRRAGRDFPFWFRRCGADLWHLSSLLNGVTGVLCDWGHAGGSSDSWRCGAAQMSCCQERDAGGLVWVMLAEPYWALVLTLTTNRAGDVELVLLRLSGAKLGDGQLNALAMEPLGHNARDGRIVHTRLVVVGAVLTWRQCLPRHSG